MNSKRQETFMLPSTQLCEGQCSLQTVETGTFLQMTCRVRIKTTAQWRTKRRRQDEAEQRK
jgi:hypothetical protein